MQSRSGKPHETLKDPNKIFTVFTKIMKIGSFIKKETYDIISHYIAAYSLQTLSK